MNDFRDPDSRMRDLDPRLDPRIRDYDDRYASESRPPWGWIAGAVFVFLVLAAVFSTGGNDRPSRTETTLPSTTGMAPPAEPRPVAPTAPPTTPAAPTGQGTAQ